MRSILELCQSRVDIFCYDGSLSVLWHILKLSFSKKSLTFFSRHIHVRSQNAIFMKQDQNLDLCRFITLLVGNFFLKETSYDGDDNDDADGLSTDQHLWFPIKDFPLSFVISNLVGHSRSHTQHPMFQKYYNSTQLSSTQLNTYTETWLVAV